MVSSQLNNRLGFINPGLTLWIVDNNDILTLFHYYSNSDNINIIYDYSDDYYCDYNSNSMMIVIIFEFIVIRYVVYIYL